jgi:hypothetical protein
VALSLSSYEKPRNLGILAAGSCNHRPCTTTLICLALQTAAHWRQPGWLRFWSSASSLMPSRAALASASTNQLQLSWDPERPLLLDGLDRVTGGGPGRITAAAWQWHSELRTATWERAADGRLGRCSGSAGCRSGQLPSPVGALHVNLILPRHTETNYLRMNVPDTSTFSWDTEKIADMAIKIRVKTSWNSVRVYSERFL